MKIVRLVLIFILLLLIITVISYLPAPVYRFQAGEPFAGDSIYNPYAQVVPDAWKKVQFHGHVSEKPKCDYTEEEYLKAYYSRGYDIVGISDHQFINLTRNERPGFIPTYEHGVNFNRYHQLMLGATKPVSWYDYPVVLTQSQMQYMIYHLRPRTKVLGLNHPGQTLGRTFHKEAYSLLSGYDLMEFNPDQTTARATDRIWDSALSNGIYSNLIGDDDAHSITRRGSWFQRCFTRVNSTSMEVDTLLGALCAGRAYVTYLPREVNLADGAHQVVPQMESLTLSGDTILLKLDTPATLIRFIGQNGTVLAQVRNSNTASYLFLPNDAYVRMDVAFTKGEMLYFNPLVRTAGGQPVQINTATVNYTLTVLQTILWLAIMGGLVLLILRLWRKRKRKNN